MLRNAPRHRFATVSRFVSALFLLPPDEETQKWCTRGKQIGVALSRKKERFRRLCFLSTFFGVGCWSRSGGKKRRKRRRPEVERQRRRTRVVGSHSSRVCFCFCSVGLVRLCVRMCELLGTGLLTCLPRLYCAIPLPSRARKNIRKGSEQGERKKEEKKPKQIGKWRVRGDKTIFRLAPILLSVFFLCFIKGEKESRKKVA